MHIETKYDVGDIVFRVDYVNNKFVVSHPITISGVNYNYDERGTLIHYTCSETGSPYGIAHSEDSLCVDEETANLKALLMNKDRDEKPN